jgi:hypothetical protein
MTGTLLQGVAEWIVENVPPDERGAVTLLAGLAGGVLLTAACVLLALWTARRDGE